MNNKALQSRISEERNLYQKMFDVIGVTVVGGNIINTCQKSGKNNNTPENFLIKSTKHN